VEAAWQLLLVSESFHTAATYRTGRTPRLFSLLMLDPLLEKKAGANFQREVSVEEGGPTGTFASAGRAASIASSTGIDCDGTFRV
jgi:hypothetical protein